MSYKKGGRNVRRGKKTEDVSKRDLIFREHDQRYGFITKVLGNSRFRVKIFDYDYKNSIILSEIIGHAPRGLKKQRMFLKDGDLVLTNIRDFQNDKVDILYQYNSTEVSRLLDLKEIPEILIGVEQNSTSSNIDCMFLDDEDEQVSTKNSKKNIIDEEEIKNL